MSLCVPGLRLLRSRGVVTRATVLVLLAGVAAVVLVVLRAKPSEEGPRRPTDDAEVLTQVAPRVPTLDAGAAAPGASEASPEAGTRGGAR